MKSTILALALALTAGSALATETPQPQPTQAKPSTRLHPSKTNAADVVPSLLVMGTKGYTLQDGKLTLKGVSPTTVVFADRPERLAGHAPTDSIIQDWAEGTNSFAKDPPNADFSTFGETGTLNAVVELKNPNLSGDTLTYDVRVLEGNLPPTGGAGSLFIDIIGRPLTPMSFAGVARRSARRAAFYGYGY
jgi:hypothetical protein